MADSESGALRLVAKSISFIDPAKRVTGFVTRRARARLAKNQPGTITAIQARKRKGGSASDPGREPMMQPARAGVTAPEWRRAGVDGGLARPRFDTASARPAPRAARGGGGIRLRGAYLERPFRRDWRTPAALYNYPGQRRPMT